VEGLAVTGRLACPAPRCALSPALLALFLAAGIEHLDAADAVDRQCVIIAVGAPGTAEYGAEFDHSAARWEEAARAGGAEVIRLGPGGSSGSAEARADREVLEEAVRRQAGKSAECLWLVLIGHGTFDGRTAKFNLRGPDVAAEELAEWLKTCERPLAVIDCASASGPFIHHLSGPRRVIVTATKSGNELNFARFGRHLADAVSDRDCDLDKDQQVSLLEAFLMAAARTSEFYEREARLATEHALIDDDGDGKGTPADWFQGIRAVRRAAGGAAPDGSRANQLVLVRRPAELAMPASARGERDRLELAIEALREEKPKLDANVYYERLEAILLELARVYERFEEAGKDPSPPPAAPPGEEAPPAK
jgi:hypothetical protein